MKTGSELIADERNRQVNVEHYSAKHDDLFTNGELSAAANCYAAPEHIYIKDDRATAFIFSDPWPWSDIVDKRYTDESGNSLPQPNIYSEDRIDFLVKAGALIAAEIDRLHRVSTTK